jgi:hypothetical protein
MVNFDKPSNTATSSTVINPSMLSNFATMLNGWLIYSIQSLLFHYQYAVSLQLRGGLLRCCRFAYPSPHILPPEHATRHVVGVDAPLFGGLTNT